MQGEAVSNASDAIEAWTLTPDLGAALLADDSLRLLKGESWMFYVKTCHTGLARNYVVAATIVCRLQFNPTCMAISRWLASGEGLRVQATAC